MKLDHTLEKKNVKVTTLDESYLSSNSHKSTLGICIILADTELNNFLSSSHLLVQNAFYVCHKDLIKGLV